ncbi:uncharacterized protein LOC122382974, partial [Amphibalanus amphitrite]|uniref:uncharacterized protein LOC122382974 n=1 Tax=Amphibalanus amphitrite TaxID=1232801 RepID=UPI001C912545
ALEELLRAGLWDHALLLSGADLPLRGVDELAAALAAHRSVSFVSTFDGWKDDPVRPQPVRTMCDNHVYTLSVEHSPDPTFRLKGSSQWFVLSREMAEFVTRLEHHPDIARRMFRFKNLGIPDEFVFSTLLFASPHRNAHINTNLHYLKMFQPNNADGLCRHQDDADFCGRGPGDFTENDLHKLKVWGVPFKFFARKFATSDPSSEVRSRVMAMAAEFSQFVQREIPRASLRYITKSALKLLQSRSNTSEFRTVSGQILPTNITKVMVFPRFGSPSDHCRPAWQLWRTAVEQFVFWVDFSVKLDGTAGASVEVRARATGAPTVRCYPFGHLLAMGLGGGYRTHDNATVRERRPPFPFLRAGVRRVTLALLFSVSGALRRQPDGGRPLALRRRSNVTAPEPVSVAVTVADGGGAVWCFSRVNITLRSLKHSQDLNVTHGSQTATVDCRAPLPSNKYTARLVQDGVGRPYQYALAFHVVPRDAGEEYRHTADLWSVENAATLPLPDYYDSAGEADPFEPWLPRSTPPESVQNARRPRDASATRLSTTATAGDRSGARPLGQGRSEAPGGGRLAPTVPVTAERLDGGGQSLPESGRGSDLTSCDCPGTEPGADRRAARQANPYCSGWPLGRPVAAAAALTALMLVLIASPRWWRRRRDLVLWLLPAAALGYLTLRALAAAACERLRAGQAGEP